MSALPLKMPVGWNEFILQAYISITMREKIRFILRFLTKPFLIGTGASLLAWLFSWMIGWQTPMEISYGLIIVGLILAGIGGATGSGEANPNHLSGIRQMPVGEKERIRTHFKEQNQSMDTTVLMFVAAAFPLTVGLLLLWLSGGFIW